MLAASIVLFSYFNLFYLLSLSLSRLLLPFVNFFHIYYNKEVTKKYPLVTSVWDKDLQDLALRNTHTSTIYALNLLQIIPINLKNADNLTDTRPNQNKLI